MSEVPLQNTDERPPLHDNEMRGCRCTYWRGASGVCVWFFCKGIIKIASFRLLCTDNDERCEDAAACT